MKLFRRNRKIDLKKREAELIAEMSSRRLSNIELLGKYEIPQTFRRIKELQNANEISTVSVGFELWLDRPITPAPKDLIPFAITGGDSCYFAFVTDYGEQEQLENCPIAFISPSDFDDSKPNQSNFLVANNIKGFLSLMISLEYAEHIRFQNIYEPEINSKLIKGITEFREDLSKEEIDLKNRTKDRIIKEFKIEPIENYYEHFKTTKELRNQKNCIKTIDGLNLKFESANELISISGLSITEYFGNYKYESKASILTAVRNAPYKFSYSDTEFDEYKANLIEVFENLNLRREKRIQEFEVEMDKIMNEWMKIRKQILEDER